MNLRERRDYITEMIEREGEVEITALARHCLVSEMTVRRDLEALEAAGVLRQVRRGAISFRSRGHEPPFLHRHEQEVDAKLAIARRAAELVGPGETVVLDIGSTTLPLARALRSRDDITVVTASIPIANELIAHGSMRVLVTGGLVRRGEASLVGSIAEDAFDLVNCDVVFLGVAGIDLEKGLTDYSLEDSRVKQRAIGSVRRTVVLADHTKLGRVAFAHVAPVSAADVIVTDAPPEHPVVVRLAEAGVEIVHVESAQAEDIGEIFR